MRKLLNALMVASFAILLVSGLALAQDPTPTPSMPAGPALPSDLLGWAALSAIILAGIAEIVVGRILLARNAALEDDKKRLSEAHNRETSLLKEQIDFLKTQLAETERLSKLKDDLLAAEKLRLQQELEEARKQAGLPAEPSLREPVRLSAEDRDTLQKLLSRLERIETIAVATDSEALLSTVEEYLRLGNARYYSAQYVEAIENYTKALALKPDYPDAFVNRGAAYDELGQYERAIQDYDQAIKLEPHDHVVLLNRGAAYDELGQYERAIQDYDQALKLKPDYPKAFNNRGNAYDELGQYERAIQDYDQAIKLKPDYPKAFNNRGNAYDELGQYERAIQDYDQAIKLKPDYPKAFHNRGITYRHLDKYQRAIQDYDQALALRPDHPDTLFDRCFAYLLLGQHERALEDYNQALSLKPSPSLEFYSRACFYSLTNDPDQALAWLRKAIEVDPSNRVNAKTDPDFDNIRHLPGFKELVGE